MTTQILIDQYVAQQRGGIQDWRRGKFRKDFVVSHRVSCTVHAGSSITKRCWQPSS
jgi:hypothetical protein